MFFNKVKETIVDYNLLNKGDHILIAHSGGLDSTVLLHILHALKEEYQLNLHSFHLNHLFRKKSALGDAQFSQGMASALNIPFTLKVFNVPEYCQERGLNAQEGARFIRYSLLDQVAKEKGCNKIALGHQANDQGETILLNILRGCALEGLKGMEPLLGNYIRPLLYSFRHELMEFCQEKGIQYREDPSNEKPIYLRNRLRMDLIPYIEDKYTPRFKEALVRMSFILREENSYLEEMAKSSFKEAMIQVAKDEVILDSAYLKDLPKALLGRILRQGYQLLRGSKEGLTFIQIQQICTLLFKGGHRLSLPFGIWVLKDYQTLTFTRREQKGSKLVQCTLPVPGEVHLPMIGMIIEAKEVEGNLFSKIKEGPAQFSSLTRIYIALDKAKTPFTIRSRREGDFFYALGMRGKKKLKDFFIQEKIPLKDRDLIPLVTDSTGTILWVAGLRMSDTVKITNSTQKIIELQLRRG